MDAGAPGTAPIAMYCRHCGYALVGLSEHRCPECGRSFDPTNPRTFRRRPQLAGVWMWLRRLAWVVVMVLAALLVLEVGVFAWYYPGMRAEHAIVDPILQAGGRVQQAPMCSRLLSRILRSIRVQSLVVRVNSVDLSDMSLTDPLLRPLPELQHLGWVEIIRSTICKDGLRHLAGAHLWSLSLQDCPLNGIGLEYLKDLPDLRDLMLLTKDQPQHLKPDYRFLADLKQVEKLCVSTWIEDADLHYLGQMTNLQELQLNEERITDGGLVHLEGLTQIRQLDLADTRIAGPGLVYLRSMSRLEMLSLAFSQLDDEGIAHLNDVTSLEVLDLTGTRVTDAGISSLTRLPRLRVLGLGDTVVSDAALPVMGMMQTLEILDLRNTRVTNKGLDSLGALPRLLALTVNGTSVTAEGVTMLKTRLPMVTIYWQPR